MIDVMLVLLIIFMIVTPLLEAGFKATMPSAANVEKAPKEDDEITLGLDANGELLRQQEADDQGSRPSSN